MKALVDTCIIIDAMQSREPFFDDAQNLLIAEANGEFDGVITASSLMDIYYITHKYSQSSRKAHEVTATLSSLFEVCDTCAEDALRAVRSNMNDYEDAVMAETAARAGADVIVTRNLKDYCSAKIKAMPPSDFLAILDRKE